MYPYDDNVVSWSNDSFYYLHQSAPLSPPCSSSNQHCDNISDEDGRVSLAYENLKHIPKRIAQKFSKDTTFLDLNYNCFKSLSFLTHFKALHTLILDRNVSIDESTLPFLPKLKILWLNNCDIKNVPKWIFRIQSQCPVLDQLSLMGNPGAKSLMSGATVYESRDFQLFIQRTLPSLKYLDGILIERENQSSTSSVAKTAFQDKDNNRSDTKIVNTFSRGAKSNLRSFLRFRRNKQTACTTSSSSQ